MDNVYAGRFSGNQTIIRNKKRFMGKGCRDGCCPSSVARKRHNQQPVGSSNFLYSNLVKILLLFMNFFGLMVIFLAP